MNDAVPVDAGPGSPGSVGALIAEDLEGVQLEPVDEAKRREQVYSIVDIQERFHQPIKEQVAADRESCRDRGRLGELPYFTVEDYVLVTRVKNWGRGRTLTGTWTGPQRAVTDDHEHVYDVEHIVSGETCHVHVARTSFNADPIFSLTDWCKMRSNTWRIRANIISMAVLM